MRLENTARDFALFLRKHFGDDSTRRVLSVTGTCHGLKWILHSHHLHLLRLPDTRSSCTLRTHNPILLRVGRKRGCVPERTNLLLVEDGRGVTCAIGINECCSFDSLSLNLRLLINHIVINQVVTRVVVAVNAIIVIHLLRIKVLLLIAVRAISRIKFDLLLVLLINHRGAILLDRTSRIWLLRLLTLLVLVALLYLRQDRAFVSHGDSFDNLLATGSRPVLLSKTHRVHLCATVDVALQCLVASRVHLFLDPDAEISHITLVPDLRPALVQRVC